MTLKTCGVGLPSLLSLTLKSPNTRWPPPTCPLIATDNVKAKTTAEIKLQLTTKIIEDGACCSHPLNIADLLSFKVLKERIGIALFENRKENGLRVASAQIFAQPNLPRIKTRSASRIALRAAASTYMNIVQ